MSYLYHYSYEPHLCNGCRDLMQKGMSFNDVAIVSIKGSDAFLVYEQR